MNLIICHWVYVVVHGEEELKCILHLDDNTENGLKLHCHSYRRKFKQNEVLKDISHIIKIENIIIPSQSLNLINQYSNINSHYREFNLTYETIESLSINYPELIKSYLNKFSLPQAILLLGPGLGRKTCHWCGKDGNSAVKAGVPAKSYCSNLYCDKGTGNAQFICGKCYQKQSAYFQSLKVDIRNVFGNTSGTDWYCLDCCINEYQTGTCCCSFRRAGKSCQIHPVASDSRMHCHSYYQKRTKEEEGPPIITLDINKLHVPLNNENNCYLFSKRSFSAESCERVKKFFYSIVQSSLQNITPIIKDTCEAPKLLINNSDNAFLPFLTAISDTPTLSTTDSDNLYRMYSTTPIASVVSEDLKKVSKKRKIDDDSDVLKQFLDDKAREISTFKNNARIDDFVEILESHELLMPILKTEDTTGLTTLTNNKVIDIKKLVLWGSSDNSSNFLQLKSTCDEYKCLSIPTRLESTIVATKHMFLPSQSMYNFPPSELKAGFSIDNVSFLNGNFIYSFPSVSFGSEDYLPISEPEFLRNGSSKEKNLMFDLTLPPPLLREFSSSLNENKILPPFSSPTRRYSTDVVQTPLKDNLNLNSSNFSSIGYGYSLDDLRLVIKAHSPEIICLNSGKSNFLLCDNSFINKPNTKYDSFEFSLFNKFEFNEILNSNSNLECVVLNYPDSIEDAKHIILDTKSRIKCSFAWASTIPFKTQVEFLSHLYKFLSLNFSYYEIYALAKKDISNDIMFIEKKEIKNMF